VLQADPVSQGSQHGPGSARESFPTDCDKPSPVFIAERVQSTHRLVQHVACSSEIASRSACTR
jgi:hypothetical protein